MLGDGSITFSTKSHPNDFWPTGLKISAKKDRYDNKIRNKLFNIISDTIKSPIMTESFLLVYDRSIVKEYYEKCGRYSNRKHLPSEFIYYDNETLAKILCGLIDTDGAIRLHRTNKHNIEDISIELNNLAILNSLMYICKKLGIKCNMFVPNTIRKNGRAKFKFNHQMYVLRLYPTSLDIEKHLCHSIKCDQYTAIAKRKHDQYVRNIKCVDNMVVDYKPIFFKDDLGEDSYVYDLMTEAHQFSANGVLTHNTGGAASVFYISKEAPQLNGLLGQDGNSLKALKNLKITVLAFETPTADVYSSCDFIVTDNDSGKTVEAHFPETTKVEFNSLVASNTQLDEEDMIMYFEKDDIVGEITAKATDTTNAVKTLQRIMNKSYMFESGTDLVLELQEIFSGNNIQFIHFEILVSQLMRDPTKPYFPYRYGPMNANPLFLGIKQVPGVESSKRGVMFERILDTVTNEVLNGVPDKNSRVKSDLEELFDI